MGTKKKMIALFTMLIFLSKFSFSNKILRHVQKNNLRRVERILKRDSSVVNKLFELEGSDEQEGLTTLLGSAAKYGFDEMVELLLRSGAGTDLNAEDMFSPLSEAVYFGSFPNDHYEKVVHTLLEHGANPNVMGTNGTPLFNWAAHFSLSKVMRMLVRCGADCLKTDREGQSPTFCVCFPEEDFQDSKKLLELSQNKQKHLESLLCEQDVNLDAIDAAIMDEDTPVCAKIKALVFLLDLRQERNHFVTDSKVKNYFGQIPFTYCFFQNEKLFRFALQNRYLQLVDCRGKTFDKSLEQCITPEMVPVVFSESGTLYKNPNLQDFSEIDRNQRGLGSGLRKLGIIKLRPSDVEENLDPNAKSLVRIIKRASRERKRKDLVDKFCRTCKTCIVLREYLPPELAAHAISFT